MQTDIHKAQALQQLHARMRDFQNAASSPTVQAAASEEQEPKPLRCEIHTASAEGTPQRDRFLRDALVYATMALASVAAVVGVVAKDGQSPWLGHRSAENERSAIEQPAEPIDRKAQIEEQFKRLKSQIAFVNVKFGDQEVSTLDGPSRLLLVKVIAAREGLEEVGLNWRDLYGIIHAETSWVSRNGASKSGVVNLGLAQFEPATAAALNLKDPNDPIQAISAAARLAKMGAEWADKRMDPVKLGAENAKLALREGVTAFYNLGSIGRLAWRPNQMHRLPKETQLHLKNSRLGAQIAQEMDAQPALTPANAAQLVADAAKTNKPPLDMMAVTREAQRIAQVKTDASQPKTHAGFMMPKNPAEAAAMMLAQAEPAQVSARANGWLMGAKQEAKEVWLPARKAARSAQP